MRIYTPDSDEVHDKAILFLTDSELRDLSGTALGLLDARGHNHVCDETYQQEIIIATLDTASVADYDERSKQVIREGK